MFELLPNDLFGAIDPLPGQESPLHSFKVAQQNGVAVVVQTAIATNDLFDNEFVLSVSTQITDLLRSKPRPSRLMFYSTKDGLWSSFHVHDDGLLEACTFQFRVCPNSTNVAVELALNCQHQSVALTTYLN